MKTPACLPTLVSAAALTLGLVVMQPTGVLAADGTGTPARQDTSPPGTVPPADNYRADYFVDYHTTTGNTGTPGIPVNRDDYISPRDQNDSRNQSDGARPMYDPFARELQRFRGEMPTRFR